jgi:hypothetical protein
MEATNCQATMNAHYHHPSALRRTCRKQLPRMPDLRCGAYRNHAPEQDVGPFRDFNKVNHRQQASTVWLDMHGVGSSVKC